MIDLLILHRRAKNEQGLLAKQVERTDPMGWYTAEERVRARSTPYESSDPGFD